MKNYKAHIAIAFICIILGFSITLQLKSVKKNKSLSSVENMRAEQLQAKLIKETEKNGDLTKQLMQYKDDLKAYQDKTAQSGDSSKILKEQLERAEIIAGLTEVEGSGIIVTLNDSKVENKTEGFNEDYFVIHDDDILKVINELNSAGAEAISVNDERYISNTEIRCAGSTISVNNNKYGTPFVIKAIGEPKTLESALTMRKGVVEILSSWGIEIKITKTNRLVIPRYSSAVNFKYAKPVVKEAN